jgi:hypothetical protein
MGKHIDTAITDTSLSHHSPPSRHRRRSSNRWHLRHPHQHPADRLDNADMVNAVLFHVKHCPGC